MVAVARAAGGSHRPRFCRPRAGRSRASQHRGRVVGQRAARSWFQHGRGRHLVNPSAHRRDPTPCRALHSRRSRISLGAAGARMGSRQPSWSRRVGLAVQLGLGAWRGTLAWTGTSAVSRRSRAKPSVVAGRVPRHCRNLRPRGRGRIDAGIFGSATAYAEPVWAGGKGGLGGHLRRGVGGSLGGGSSGSGCAGREVPALRARERCSRTDRRILPRWWPGRCRSLAPRERQRRLDASCPHCRDRSPRRGWHGSRATATARPRLRSRTASGPPPPCVGLPPRHRVRPRGGTASAAARTARRPRTFPGGHWTGSEEPRSTSVH